MGRLPVDLLVEKKIFLKRYTKPPIKALNRTINKTKKEKIAALLSEIPIRESINARVFSLTPNPPMEIGRFATIAEKGSMNKKDINLRPSPTVMEAK